MGQILYNNSFNFDIPYTAEELIEYAIRKNELENFILVVPTGKFSRRLNNYTVKKYFEFTGKPVKEPSILTLNKFVEYCYDKVFSDRSRYQLSDAYRLAILEEASEKANLDFFVKKDQKLSPFILKRLANIIFGLKEDGISIRKLEEDLSNSGNPLDDASRLSDIIKLYNKYNEMLGSEFLDFPEIQSRITNFIENSKKGDILKETILNDIKYVLLTGFSDFKSPELDFISQFQNSDIPFALNLDFSTNNGPLFGNLTKGIEELIRRGFLLTSPDDMTENEIISGKFSDSFKNIEDCPREIYLRSRLFNTDNDIRNSSFSDIISIFETFTRGEEVRCIAKYVKYKIIEEKIKPSNICVCMRQPELYSDLFREIFSSYKIPANISDRFDLSSSPVISVIFTALDILYYEYRLEDVHKFLLSGYVKVGDEKFNKVNLYEHALKYRIFGGFIRGGAAYWEKILSSRIESIEKQINQIKNYPNTDTSVQDSIEKQKIEIAKALEDFLYLKSVFPIKKKKYSADDFEGIILDLIKDFRIKDNVIANSKEILKNSNLSAMDKVIYQEAIEKDTRALESFFLIIREMSFIIKERNPNHVFNLKDLIYKLKIAVYGKKYQIKEKSDTGVNITSIEQARGIRYPVMILCGAVDGEFPMKYTPDSFLGLDLHNSYDRHIQSERMQFFQFLTNDKNRLDHGNTNIVITYPKTTETEDLVRSSFIDSLLKITNLEIDNKIYDIDKIKDPIDRSESENNTAILKQSEDIQWINMIQNLNELYIQAENLKSRTSELINAASFQLSEYVKIKLKRTTEFIKYYHDISSLNDGILNINDLPIIAKQRLSDYRENPVSISDLELYATCPFKFFVRKILNISGAGDSEVSLSPMDRGNVIHKILFDFYSVEQLECYDNRQFDYIIKPKTTNIPYIQPVKLERNNSNKYLDRLLKLARRELEVYHIDHPYFQNAKDLIIGYENHPGILEIWLNEEFDRIEKKSFDPVLFELPFGLTTNFKQGTYIDAVDIDGLKIKGKIDRIELFRTGDSYNFIVGDYKNNLKVSRNNNDILNGISFQMPIYILAAEKILKEFYDIDVKKAGAVYYGFEPEKNKDDSRQQYHKYVLIDHNSPLMTTEIKNKRSQVLKKGEYLEDILNSNLEMAKSIIQNISNGKFPIEPQKSACRYCDFSSICRIKEKLDMHENEVEIY